MDSTAFVRGLFGNGKRVALGLPEPIHAARLVVSAQDMAAPGWLQRVCHMHEGAVQIVTANGDAVALIQDCAAARLVAADQLIVAPEVFEPPVMGDLFE